MHPIQIMRLRNASSGGGGSDPFFSNVTSLLHFDGSFTDQKGKVWTPAGSATTSSGQVKFGSASGRIPTATTGFITTPASTDWDFGTGDFTDEGWIYTETAGGCPMINNQATTNKFLSLFLDTTTTARVIINNTNVMTGISVPAGAFFHYALVRSSGVLTAWVNGASAGSAAFAGNIGGNDAVTLMGSTLHTGWIGYLDDRRTTKGIARYTAPFAPPSAAFPNS